MTGAPITLVEAVEEFLRSLEADGLSPASRNWYRSILKGFCETYQVQDEPRVLTVQVGQSAFNQGDVIAPRCPVCGSCDRQIKAGKNQSGSQRFRCVKCNRKYTPKKEGYK